MWQVPVGTARIVGLEELNVRVEHADGRVLDDTVRVAAGSDLDVGGELVEGLEADRGDRGRAIGELIEKTLERSVAAKLGSEAVVTVQDAVGDVCACGIGREGQVFVESAI